MRKSITLLWICSLLVLSIVPVAYADDCGNRKIGIVGASNTVGRSFVQSLKNLCPDSDFIVRAKSGSSPAFGHKSEPPSQLDLLKQLPLIDLDMVIINPSGNTCNNPKLIPNQIDALSRMVEAAKSAAIDDVVVLTISPRRTGQLPCIEVFNQELTTTKYGIQEINHVVDIYPILEDTNVPGACGYCGKDGVHWTSLGDQRVAQAIFYGVFKGTSPPSLPDKTGVTPPAVGSVDACGNKKIGVIGASNTAAKNSYAKQLKKLCPTSTIIVEAKAGYSPWKQYDILWSEFDDDHPLDILIVNPSANGIGDLDRHKQGVLLIAEAAKQEETGIVAVMGIGASEKKGISGNKQLFNDELHSSALGRPELIDKPLELVSVVAQDGTIYGATDKKYMSAGHFSPLGHKRLAVAIYNQIFGKNLKLPESSAEFDATVNKLRGVSAPSTTFTHGTPSATLVSPGALGTAPQYRIEEVRRTLPHCLSTTRCEEIDEVWSKWLGSAIGGSGRNKVWAKVGNIWKWNNFRDTYYEKKQVLVGRGVAQGVVSQPTYTTGPKLPGITFVPGISADRLDGIDVSTWQGGDIDWGQVASQGIKFAFVRSTFGGSGVDKRYHRNLQEAQKHGIVVGCYHFAHPGLEANDAMLEAQNFLAQSQNCLKDSNLLPVLDLEDGSEYGKQVLGPWTKQWMDTVERATGLKPILYGSNYARDYVGNDIINKYPLWIANWRSPQSKPKLGKWKNWVFWQYSNKGRMAGITANVVDLNFFQGNEQELQQYTIGNAKA